MLGSMWLWVRRSAPLRRAMPLLLAMAVLLAACGDGAATAPRRLLDPDRRCDHCTLVDPRFDPLPNTTAAFGALNGAAYRYEVPDDWNGTLILVARGFGGLNADGTDFEPVLDFGDFDPLQSLAGSPPLRSLLIPLGYAWAASTNRYHGYAPGVGVDDLLALKDRFVAEVGEPRRVYVIGGSMGGATAQVLAQEFPQEIDGALALCGALANAAAVDYLASWHALAAWVLDTLPDQIDGDGIEAWAAPLGRLDPDGRLRLTPDGERFVALIRALTGGDRWGFEAGLAAQWRGNWRLGALFWPEIVASGAAPRGGTVISHDSRFAAFDTTELTYRGDPPGTIDLAALNAEVIRFAAVGAARADPALGIASGRLSVPLLTLKGTGDLYTPISLDAAYQARVEAAGDAGNLVTRAVRHAGHCVIQPLEGLRAFTDLVAWVESGVVPAGEDLSAGLTEAGVAFTAPFDAGDPLAR